MKRMKLSAIVLTCIVLFTNIATAIERHVPSEYSTIQAAINASSNGDVVIVAPGTYTGDGNRDIDFLGKAITIRSTDPNAPSIVATTIIDCNGSSSSPHRGFYFHNNEGNTSIIAGITITRGYSDHGGGIYCCYASPTIINCHINGNTTSGYGGGIFGDHSNTAITGCTIIDNDALYGYGAGISIDYGTPTITRCYIKKNGNPSGNNRGALYLGHCSAIVNNCLLTENKSQWCICCRYSGNSYITNCTIANNNPAVWGGGIHCMDGGNATVTNCICRGNHYTDSSGGLREIYENVTVSYTNIQDNSDPTDWKYVAGIGNIDADPLFLAADYYYLSPSSPCIDTGTNSPPGGLPGADIDGSPRPVDGNDDGVSTADMGSYEFAPGLPSIIWHSPQGFNFYTVEGGPNPVSQILSIRNIGGGTLSWEATENCAWLQVDPNSGDSTGEIDEVDLSIDTTGLSSGTYQCILAVTADGALNNPQIVSVNLFVGKPQIELSTNNLEFSGIHGILNPPEQIITIRNSSVGTLNWTIDCGCDWLQANPSMGSSTGEPDEVILSVDCIDLDFGSYNCVLTISDPCAGNSPQIVNVTLHVYNDNLDGILKVPSEYDTIQSAIDEALDGNTVLVADGTYIGPGNRDIDFKGKMITVKSENGPEHCIIDCDGTYEENHRGFYFNNGEGLNSVLEGFTITNAYVAVMCEGGAGIYIDGASPTINKCAITNNHAQLVPESLCFCLGGGIYIGYGSNPLITNCIINGNSVGDWGWGGGIYCAAYATVRNCLISNNTALGYEGMGGGIYGSLTVFNCTIANNSTTNDGGGIYGPAIVSDSIIWANTAINQIQGSANITYSDVQGGFPGTGNINADPRFVTGAMGDYYLSQTAAGQATNSPCVDTGSDTAENLNMNSLITRTDGVPDTGVVNMGYHYPTSIVILDPDLDGNYFVDFFDYALMAINWQQSPDACDPNSGDIIKNGIVDIYDLAELCTDWLACFVTFAAAPEPADHSLGVSRYATLRWSPGENSISHDVYFGTDFNAVDMADTTNSGMYMGNQYVNHWDSNNYANELGTDTTYYWRIDEIGPACSTKGSVWNFTTIETNGPAAWWKFDEGTGAIAYDSAGNNNNGTIYGATWTAGKIGSALSFDGTNDYVDCGSGPSNYDNITVSAWMQTSTNGVLVSNRDSAGSYGTWYTLLSTRIEIGDNSQGGYRSVTFITPTLNGTWHHVVYTKNGTNHTIYVDGSLDQQFTSNADISQNSPLFIGKRWTRSNDPSWFNGIIDDVRIYNRDLSAEEAELLYQQGL